MKQVRFMLWKSIVCFLYFANPYDELFNLDCVVRMMSDFDRANIISDVCGMAILVASHLGETDLAQIGFGIHDH